MLVDISRYFIPTTVALGRHTKYNGFCKRNPSLSWAWERSLAGPDGLANITRPRDELFQERVDLLKERGNNLEWL